MTTAYPLDATTALPRVRRPSTSFEPRIAESSQSIKTLAKIFVLSTSAVVLVAALLMIQIDNPPTNERGCILSANLHKFTRAPGWSTVGRWSNRQYLWIKIFYAASSVAVVSSGRSTSLPFSNFAPARTSATRWGALTARQRDWAASISL